MFHLSQKLSDAKRKKIVRCRRCEAKYDVTRWAQHRSLHIILLTAMSEQKSHSDFLLFQHRSSTWYYFITDTSRSLSKVLLGHSTFLPSPTFQFCCIVLFEFFWVRVSMFQNALNYFDENKKYFVSFSRLQILILERQAKNVWLITWNLKRSNKINERKLVSTTECD